MSAIALEDCCYLSPLEDDRVTYFEGQRIKDLMEQPAFATPATAIARGYDRYYSAEPGATNPLVVAPRSPQELRERAGIISEMDLALNVTYQSLMTLLTAAWGLQGADPVFQDRLRALHRRRHRGRYPHRRMYNRRQ